MNSFVSKDSEDTWISLPGWVDSSSFAVIARRLEEGDLDHIKSRVKYVVMAAVESPVTVHIYGSDYAVASFWDYGSDKHSFADDKLIKVAFNVKEGKVVSILGVSAEAGMLKDGIDNRVDIACGEI